MDIEGKRSDIRKLQASISHQESARNDKMRRFGERIPALLQKINAACQHNQRTFKYKPRGPIGECNSMF